MKHKIKLNPKKVCERVRLLRQYKNVEQQKHMAALIGIDPKRYDHWENGRTVIPVAYAIELSRITGADLNYIYQGDMASLPLALVNFLISKGE